MPIGKPRFPKRNARFTVGKEIGGAIYVHREYEYLLPEAVQTAKAVLPITFKYTIVKYATSKETVSFIQSEDFDESDEPIAGDLYTINIDGSVSFRRHASDPWIYHHKWLFVADDYKGFDVEVSKLDLADGWRLTPSIFVALEKKVFGRRTLFPD